MAEILQRFGIRKRETTPPPPQTFRAYYEGVTPEQLRQCNYPDNFFTAYGVWFSHRGIDYELVITHEKNETSSRALWITTPLIILTTNTNSEGLDTLTRLKAFVPTAAKVGDLLQQKGDFKWEITGEDDYQIKTVFWPQQAAEAPGLEKLFSTKEEVAGFIESLPLKGLKKLHDPYALFTKMTMAELMACNLPQETWPRDISDQKTLKRMPYPLSPQS